MIHHPPEPEPNNSDSSVELIDSDFPASDITSEKNLWQILKLSFLLPKRGFNIVSTIAFFISLLIYAFFTNDSPGEIREVILVWAERGFSFSIGILGFLVAGVAIFSAANDVRLFTHLARVKHKSSGVSYLKYNLIALMYVFIVYLFLAFLCFVVQIVSDTSLFWNFLILRFSRSFFGLEINEILLAGLVNKATYVALSTLFCYCLLLLKTFIFDLYALIMVNIRWNFESEENQKSSDVDAH